MNKWMKNGMTGLVLSAAALAAAVTVPVQSEPKQDDSLSAVSIDALDLAGGSKLKDRMVEAYNNDMEIVRAVIQA